MNRYKKEQLKKHTPEQISLIEADEKQQQWDGATNFPELYASNYTFNSMGQWDHQINTWVKLFKEKHGYFPNILLASSATYARIDLVANARGKDQLRGPTGETPSEEEFASMQGFKGNGYELDFCIEEQLGVDTVRLIYDSDPDGGLPIPEEEEFYLEDVAG